MGVSYKLNIEKNYLGFLKIIKVKIRYISIEIWPLKGIKPLNISTYRYKNGFCYRNPNIVSEYVLKVINK